MSVQNIVIGIYTLIFRSSVETERWTIHLFKLTNFCRILCLYNGYFILIRLLIRDYYIFSRHVINFGQKIDSLKHSFNMENIFYEKN